jgi:hypothetical protein
LLRFDILGDVAGDPLDSQDLTGVVVNRHASMFGVHDAPVGMNPPQDGDRGGV